VLAITITINIIITTIIIINTIIVIIIIILVVAITFTTMMMIMVIATMRSEFCIVVLCSTDDLFQHISTILHLSQPDCSV
jgi:hypothetical protein